MTGSHEVRSSILLSSTNNIKGLAYSAALFLFQDHPLPPNQWVKQLQGWRLLGRRHPIGGEDFARGLSQLIYLGIFFDL